MYGEYEVLVEFSEVVRVGADTEAEAKEAAKEQVRRYGSLEATVLGLPEPEEPEQED